MPVELDWDELAADFEAYHARFADLFARAEPRERSRHYLRGLLGGSERRNGWQLAEALGEARPDGTQRLLQTSTWSAQTARDRYVAFCAQTFGDPGGIAILDETGFLKQGVQSVGVARQYTGTAGKITNCQVGVFLGYVSRHGHVLIDRGLYLPKAWTDDPDRCQRAGIPAHVTFRTKPTLGRRMLHRAARLGLPVAWVTGDEVYGDDPRLRAWLARQSYRYVLAVARSTLAWDDPPMVTIPVRSGGRGRPPTRPVVTPSAQRVEALAAAWPVHVWQRFAAYQGEKGPIEYDWACLRVCVKDGRVPGPEQWLLVRRAVSDPTEHAYYLSDAPADTPLATLAHVAAARFTIEQLIEEGKDDVGMDQYEVRTWTAWYRFITLCMMSLGWVASVRRNLADRAAAPPRDPLLPAPPLPVVGMPEPTPAAPTVQKGGPQSPRPSRLRPGRSPKSVGSSV